MNRNIVALAGAGLIALGLTGAARAQLVGLGTNPPGVYTHSAGTAIAAAVNGKTGMQVRVQPYGGSTAYVPLIENGELEMGFVNAVEATLAIEGHPIFQNRKAENLRAVAVVVPFVVMFYVKKDSPIRTMRDLKGKTIPGGYASQQILTHMNAAMFANAGYDISDMKILNVPNNARGTDEFIAGKTDAFYFSIGAAKVREADAAVGGVRAIGIDTSPEAIARMQKAIPLSYPMRVEPNSAYPGILEPTTFMAFDYLIVAGAKTPDDVVYRFVKAMHDSKSEMVASFAAMRDFEPAKMAAPLSGVAYHPGALKFYREAGLTK
jgi:hypothetical protein